MNGITAAPLPGRPPEGEGSDGEHPSRGDGGSTGEEPQVEDAVAAAPHSKHDLGSHHSHGSSVPKAYVTDRPPSGCVCDWIPNDNCVNSDACACYCRAQHPEGPCLACQANGQPGVRSDRFVHGYDDESGASFEDSNGEPGHWLEIVVSCLMGISILGGFVMAWQDWRARKTGEPVQYEQLGCLDDMLGGCIQTTQRHLGCLDGADMVEADDENRTLISIETGSHAPMATWPRILNR